MVELALDPGEKVIAEAGAMTYLEQDITFETKMGEGFSVLVQECTLVEQCITPRMVCSRVTQEQLPRSNCRADSLL